MIALIRSMRPSQWVKNIFVFAPLVFALKFTALSAWMLSGLAALSFILVSGAIYIINDLSDIEVDRLHPVKKHRPIPAGEVSRFAAIVSVLVLLAIATIIASLLPRECIGVLATYFVINIIYSRGLKHLAIVDVLFIATGFVLRVLMGGFAIGVAISPWIIMATFMLALFLGFGKRRHEIRSDKGTATRSSLEQYNKEFLDKLINVTCAAAFLSYAMYAVEMAQKTGKISMVYTVIFAAFGIFRYLQFIYFDKEGGEPERIVRDPVFMGNFIAWLFITLWILS